MAIVTPPYHFALVVEDLEQAMEDLGAVLGLSWSRVQRKTSTRMSEEGTTSAEIAFVYSIQGPPHFELFERRDGTTYDKVGLHHVGLWCDDPAAESDRLKDLGWPFESVAVKPDGSWAGGLYHVNRDGLRIEVVGISTAGPKYVRIMNGGDYV